MAPGGEHGELRSEGASSLLYGRRHTFGPSFLGDDHSRAPQSPWAGSLWAVQRQYPGLPSEGGYGGTISVGPAWAAAGEAVGSIQETPRCCPI